MITYLKGKYIEKEPNHTVMEVNGIGYEVRISLNTFSQIKNLESGILQTHLQVKEDAHILFGFAEMQEKQRFLDLISINGVGPGTALMILSSLTPSEIHEAIVSEDVNLIQRVKGVGAKTAQRIILELKDKLKKEDVFEKSPSGTGVRSNSLRNEALSALLVLGFPKAQAEKNIDLIIKEKGGGVTLEELIRLALKNSR
ncbi:MULTISPECIES: Holliday junction branch migration protein RuvA [Imperialibacter]|jgi:holliday junction DNA helicase RuvA|uniref:Holliday junction branch migration complex subunit RuvA n=1 Tax=Imperialibacter roseus TaxID=1324217 RepID=A0ABZ0INH9_9BACT|nr:MULTISPECIES: Holliday junction branch migration protein RuvA [Imperialibacter]WOK05530.1 Holliday junction branch migration protein RuvA [Imperialibacter roseus]CAD5292942.1 Holliday junction ATP-dependent DNA helicase RuvA [Imperialibacter sp. 89]CAD5293997.1 Holliday junction ATP-dependent DNA helicase RuvA [Imperialibacter sp. 75]VVT28559.1 Holliday junction ATP-dependent DNA helicase RuvA [Imperialibacter sp. EC-SDR9]